MCCGVRTRLSIWVFSRHPQSPGKLGSEVTPAPSFPPGKHWACCCRTCAPSGLNKREGTEKEPVVLLSAKELLRPAERLLDLSLTLIKFEPVAEMFMLFLYVSVDMSATLWHIQLSCHLPDKVISNSFFYFLGKKKKRKGEMQQQRDSAFEMPFGEQMHTLSPSGEHRHVCVSVPAY